jgi:hypothetical protein
MKVETKKLLEFKQELEEINKAAKTPQNKISLSDRQDGVKLVQEYYTYLKNSGEFYGELALRVVNNKGFFGEFANIHLRTQAVFDGIAKEYLPELQDRIKISLAYVDIEQRLEEKDTFNDKSISKYHKAVFEKQGLSHYAWGGLALEELLGSGAWMMMGDFKEQDFQKMLDQLSKIGSKEGSNYSLDRMVRGMGHTFTCYTKGESDYVPMVRAADSWQAAKMFDVEPSRAFAVEDDTDWMDSPLVRCIVYKILPEKTKIHSLKKESKKESKKEEKQPLEDFDFLFPKMDEETKKTTDEIISNMLAINKQVFKKMETQFGQNQKDTNDPEQFNFNFNNFDIFGFSSDLMGNAKEKKKDDNNFDDEELD